MTAGEMNKALFMNLIAMFHSLAWQQMGKIRNPVTDSIQQDLEGAKNIIDTLEMLREKSKGNLDSDEERLLTQILHELRLNYVDEMNRHAPEPARPEGGGRSNDPETK
jgi:hypothetical protein